MNVSERIGQQAIQDNEPDWSIALESAETGTWILDLESGLVHWNDCCRSFFGHTRVATIPFVELIGLIDPDDLNLVRSVVQQIMQPQATRRFEQECRVMGAHDRIQRWLRLRGKVTGVREGKPTQFAGTVLDITEERRKKSTLQHAESHLPGAFNNAPVGIVITYTDGRFIQANKAFGHITGYSTAELTQSTYALILHPDDLQQYQYQVNELLTGGSGSVVAEVRCIHKQGHVVWVNLHTTRIQGESGAYESLFSVVQDITEEVTVRHNQQKMLTLVDNSQLFMAIADLEGRLTYFNKAGRNLIGMDETESLAGRTVADFYTPEQYKWMLEVAVPTLLAQGQWSGRVQLKHMKTGELIPCHASGIRIMDPATGKPMGRGFTMRDLRPELSAQEAQRKLLTLVDNSIELMSILEMDGKNSYINKAGMAMLGFASEQEIQETPISELHAPEHFALVEQEVLPSVMNTGRWSGEMLVRHLKTGEIFPVFNNTVRIDDPASGQPLAVGAVMRDMRPEVAARQALLESEARFRNMIMQAPVAIGLLQGEELIIESANEYILTLWGRRSDIIGKPIVTALPEIEGQEIIDLLKGVYKSGNPYYGYEVPVQLYRRGILEDCYFNFVYAPIWEGKEVIKGVMVVATEVTGQVRAKNELAESEKRFRNLVLDAPVATAVYTGRDMIIQLANDAMLSLWGKDASVVGKKLREVLPELEEQPFYQLLEKVYDTGNAYQGTEDRVELNINGKRQAFYFDFTYKPLRDAAGNVYAILNMAVDMSYQVTAKQRLTETQESLREAIDLAELAPWTTNVLTGEMVCAERVSEWLGVTETVTPEVISRCIHEKDRAHVDQIVQAAMDPGSGGRMDLEYRVVNQQTQQELFLRTQARVLFTDQGMPYLIRGTSQDITAQRMTEQALEKQVQLRTEELMNSNLLLKRSNQELERYAYVASHDLQEPLRKIQMYSSLIRERYMRDFTSEGVDHLVKVEESANRMSVLIKNILDFSRINHDSGFVSSVDLNAIVGAVVKDFELILAQKKGRVDIGRLCAVPAIPLQMTQLFYNLISNSLKFSREGVPPVISISSRQLTESELRKYGKLNPQLPHCLTTVSDNGIGFNPAFSEKIFGLFQRLHHQQQYEGTGIGLSLCQRIVFNHHGEIWADSEEGKGATFQFILPMSR